MTKNYCTAINCIRQGVRNPEIKPPYESACYTIERTCHYQRDGLCPFPFNPKKKTKEKEIGNGKSQGDEGTEV